ncbi:MAG: undecaprenyldiphospho-muramoylpentapeptide beta-N-acetylglucosaminyltransferase [Ruminococcaceae bacterium]|nr:undecaprenyldiphospho-muramoylpentapeptide beta-N-acetylglucosaminyltransferase [Oscillospiraceae bacterium]
MRIVLSGGGTGGHIYPAIAIANYVKEQNPDAEILFIGNAGGMESKLVPRAGYPINYIQVQGLRRRISIENLKTAVRLVTSYHSAKKILREFAPDIVIGTGGYVCLPVVLAATALKIRSLVHEQNVFPGLTVRMCAGRADTAISFPETEKYFKKTPKRLLLTGNPIRPELLRPATEKKPAGEPLVVISGGSLGAQKINDTLIALLKMGGQDYYGIIASTGERNYEAVMQKIKEEKIRLCENKKILPYIHDMDTVLKRADLAVTRAGAITVSELSAMGKPAILIPSPNVTNDHQTYNARTMEKNGAAVLLPESELSAEVLAGQIKTLLSSQTHLRNMARAAKDCAILDACQRIYTWICEK